MSIRLLSALAVAAIQTPLSGQDSDSPGALPASVEAHVGVTQVTGVAAGYAGVAATLGLGHGFRIGGGAWSVLRRIDEASPLHGLGLDLGVGYGGAIVEYGPPSLPISIRLLVGGGAATLRTTPVGTPFDTETFVVIEPAVVARATVVGVLEIGAMVSYRTTRAVDPTFLDHTRGLGGLGGSAFLRLGR